MFCRYCGAELTGRFCASCGKPAEEPAAPAPAPLTGQDGAAEPTRQETPWNPAKSMERAEENAPVVPFETSDDAQRDPLTESESEEAEEAASDGETAASDPFEIIGDFNENEDDITFLFETAPIVAEETPLATEEDAGKHKSKSKKAKKKESKKEKKKAERANAKKAQNATRKGKKDKAPVVAGKDKEPIRFRSALFAALALFFPAAYFFFDLFVVYGDALTRKATTGAAALQQFINWSTSSAYDANSAAEIMSGAFGESTQLVSFLSCSVLFEDTAYFLPVICTLVAAALSVLAGLLVLCSGARLLRCRVFLDLMTLVGLAAAMAPLFGETVYLVSLYMQTQSFSVVNRNMARLGLSVESMLILCVCVLFLIPALKRLRSLGDRAAGREYPVILPCAALGAKFFTAKLFTVLLLLLCLAFPVLFLMGPVYSPELDLMSWDPTGVLVKAGEALQAMISGGDTVNVWMLVLSLLAETVLFLQVPLLATACMPLLWQLFRVIFTRKHYTPKKNEKKKKRRPAGNVGGTLATRGVLLLPYLSFVCFGILAVLLLLFASRIAIHLDFSDPDTTLCTVYLVIAYVKSLGGTSCAYSLLMLLGAPLWHLVRNFHNAMASHREPRASEEPSKAE